MKTEIIAMAEELTRQCDYFLSRYTPESKTRVVQEGIEPVLRVVRDILNLPSVAPINIMEVAQIPVGKGEHNLASAKSNNPLALVRVGVSADGRLVQMITTMDVPFLAGPPSFVTLDQLIQVHITAYDLVMNMKKLAFHIAVDGSATQAGGIA